MRKSLVGHAVFAVVAAVAALVAWNKPTKTAVDDTVVAVAGSPALLETISWREDGWEVTIAREAEGARVTRQKRPRKPKIKKSDSDKKAEKGSAETPAPPQEVETSENDSPAEVAKAEPEKPAPTPEPAPLPPPESYPGTERAGKLFEELAPLTATRLLGNVDAQRVGSFGLNEPEAKLTLGFKAGEKVVEIGKASYGGSTHYARLQGSQEAFLVPSRTVSALRYGASGLLDRRALGLDREAIERLVVTTPTGQIQELLHRRSGDNDDKDFFANPAAPDEKLDEATRWVERLLRVRVTSLEAEEKTSAPAVEVAFEGAKGPLGLFKLWSNGDGKEAVASSERFPKPFRIGTADGKALLRDLQEVLKAEN